MLATVVEQTVKQAGVHVELCIVDNASRDGTWELLQELKERDYPLILHRNFEDKGAAESLNIAASFASGRYFIFQSARSWYEPGALKEMVYVLDKHPGMGFVYGKTQYHGLNEYIYCPPMFDRTAFAQHFDSLFGYLYRREAYDRGCRYQWYIEREGQRIDLLDWDFAMQLIVDMGYTGLALTNQLVLHYHYSGAGQMTELVHRYDSELTAEFRKRWWNPSPRVRGEWRWPATMEGTY
jgi:glycosyltransferase involved in cell wall biosynthesis